MAEITDEQIREALNDVANYLPATAADLRDCFNALIARLERAEKERDEARQSNARLNRRAQEAEAAADRLAKIEARIAERNTRKPLPRIEAAFALAAAEERVAALEAALRCECNGCALPGEGKFTAQDCKRAALRGLEGK